MDLSCRPGRLVASLTLFLLLAACGRETDPPAPRPPASAPERAVEALGEVDEAARAAFAMDRLLKGPLPRTGAFAIPKLHTLNLKHAEADLLALPQETLRLLDDPAMRRRLTSARAGSQNAWHGILDVLKRIPDKPAELAIAWTRDARDSTDVPLVRRAVDVLASVDDDQARELLLSFLERRPRDREVAGVGGRALVQAGSPWRERALRLLYREGAITSWKTVAGWLDGEEDAESALAAWALLAETGAPRPAAELHRTTHPLYYPARLLLDARVWPKETEGMGSSVLAGRLFAPAYVEDGGGFLPARAGSSALVETASLGLQGKLYAADARCRLAKRGYAAAVAGVEADLAGRDQDLAETARSCRLGAQPLADIDAARDIIEQFFSALDARYAVGADGIAQALAVLASTDEKATLEVLVRVLEEARPRETYMPLLETVQDMLLGLDAERLRAWVAARLESTDPDEIVMALRLMRRTPSVAYVPALLEAEGASSGAMRNEFRRVLLWTHAVAEDVDEAARAAFVPRVETWIEPMADRALVALLPGLLDLGEAGARAYVKGLLGPRRRLYVEALLGRPGPMPLEVAEALLTKVDGATSSRERRQVLIATYMGAPASAAPALAAARARLEESVRAEADDVLEAVRHRAPR